MSKTYILGLSLSLAPHSLLCIHSLFWPFKRLVSVFNPPGTLELFAHSCFVNDLLESETTRYQGVTECHPSTARYVPSWGWSEASHTVRSILRSLTGRRCTEYLT